MKLIYNFYIVSKSFLLVGRNFEFGKASLCKSCFASCS